jgi:hypothetical protein
VSFRIVVPDSHNRRSCEVSVRTWGNQLVEPQATLGGCDRFLARQMLVGGNLLGELMLLNAASVACDLGRSLGIIANAVIKVRCHVQT